MSMVEQAIIYATTLHSGQKDKAGVEYIFHPLRVMMALKAEGADNYTLAVAVMHDLMEDRNVTREMLEGWYFTKDVIDALELLNHKYGDDYINDYIKVIEANKDSLSGKMAKQVKIADILDNTSEERMRVIKINNFKDYKRLAKKYTRAWEILVGTNAMRNRFSDVLGD